MSVIDTVQLLEQRTQKAAGLIVMLRKEKAEMQQKLDSLVNQPAADPTLAQKLESESGLNAELQTKLAESTVSNGNLSSELQLMKKQLTELQDKFDLVNNHNAELEEYVQKFTTSNKLLEESINKAMDNLSHIEGLDDIPLEAAMADELSAADDYTSGGALNGEQIENPEDL